VADIQGGTTPEGIHLGAMAGTVDQIQRCYTGIVTRSDMLLLNPCLPAMADPKVILFRRFETAYFYLPFSSKNPFVKIFSSCFLHSS